MVLKLHPFRQLDTSYSKKEVYWLWGPTGTGKTRAVYELCNPESFWRDNGNSQWFDGYTGQEDVLIDDLRAGNWPYARLLQLLDGYSMRVAVKGTFLIWKPRRIFITSPYAPDKAFEGQVSYNDNIDQLLRRITKIFELPEDAPISLYVTIPKMFKNKIVPPLPPTLNDEDLFVNKLVNEPLSPVDVDSNVSEVPSTIEIVDEDFSSPLDWDILNYDYDDPAPSSYENYC